HQRSEEARRRPAHPPRFRAGGPRDGSSGAGRRPAALDGPCESSERRGGRDRERPHAGDADTRARRRACRDEARPSGRVMSHGQRRSIPSPLGDAPLTTPGIDGLARESIGLMPDVRVIKIGGQSILDRGRKALAPLIDEIVAVKDRYPLLLWAGGGTRARHAYELALDLALPTGVLAALGGYVPR